MGLPQDGDDPRPGDPPAASGTYLLVLAWRTHRHSSNVRHLPEQRDHLFSEAADRFHGHSVGHCSHLDQKQHFCPSTLSREPPKEASSRYFFLAVRADLEGGAVLGSVCPCQGRCVRWGDTNIHSRFNGLNRR